MYSTNLWNWKGWSDARSTAPLHSSSVSEAPQRPLIRNANNEAFPLHLHLVLDQDRQINESCSVIQNMKVQGREQAQDLSSRALIM